MASGEGQIGRERVARTRKFAWLADRRSHVGAPERAWLIVAVVGFIAMSAWWLTRNQRIPDWDDGAHLLDAVVAAAQIHSFQFGALFQTFDLYPPFGHVIGALGILIAKANPLSVIMASNLVFVPALAAGCYGVGRLVFGTPLAGLLAAVFALGTPMIISDFHVFMLDPPEAAMVALSVWGILASRRFDRPGVSALAGLATGLAIMTKQTAVLFVAGPVLVALARGGWRAWRGLLAFAIVAGVICVPWYIDHLSQLQAESALWSTPNSPSYASPERFSTDSLAWYFWNAVNTQLLVPLVLLSAIGIVAALRGCLPRPRRDDLRVDLLVGGLIGWFGVTMLIHKDPRYSLPDLVYIAALGTGWIATIQRKSLRRALSGAAVAVALVNFFGVSLGIGATELISVAGHLPATSQNSLIYYSPSGYPDGGPQSDGNVPALMSALYRAGYRYITVEDGPTGYVDFNQPGLDALAAMDGLTQTPVFDSTDLGGPRGVMFLLRARVAGDPPACTTLDNGVGVYVAVGDASLPFEAMKFFCPYHHPALYSRTAPLPPAIAAYLEPRIPEPWRSRIGRLLLELKAQGIAAVQFDYGSANVPFFAFTQLHTLAASVGVTAQPFDPPAVKPNDAFLLRHADGAGEPPPCMSFPDGTGLYIVLGTPYIPFPNYEFYCPTRTPRKYPSSTR
jgi:Dolichyl-phosphate-mannose-protein mannosyltransferase